ALVGRGVDVAHQGQAHAGGARENVDGIAVPDGAVALDVAEVVPLDVLITDEDRVAEPVRDRREVGPAGPLRAVADAEDDRSGGAGQVVGGDRVVGVVAGGGRVIAQRPLFA